MDETDLVPSESPTLAQQFDALKKGLGRAVVWAMGGKLELDPIREACLHDLRYDWQIEPARSPWLWDIIVACAAVDQLHEPILDAFSRLPEESANQLCGLARHYAAAGYEDFRARLYEVVRVKPISAMDWLGEDDLVALDGEAGFEFVVGVRGERLDAEPWEWTHAAVMHDAVERWGRDRAVRLLETSDIPGARQFLAAWPGEGTKPTTDARDAHRDRMRAIPVADILSAAGNPDRCIWFRGWGRHAEDADLRTVLLAIRRESDPHRLARLLRVFSGRPLPEFDERVLELAAHPNPDVRGMATRVLEQDTHPAIRDLALKLLTDPNTAAEAVALFVNNYTAGDEARILSALPTVPEDDLHYALMAAEKVLSANDHAAPLPLGLFAYRYNPCGHCRESVAELLHRRGSMPDWVRNELRYDSYEDARKLADPTGEAAAARQ